MKRKNIFLYSILTMLYVLCNIGISEALSSNEDEFSSILNRYNTENVIVENGISLRMGEQLDLSDTNGWQVSNQSVVRIDENEIVHPIKSGTVFLSNEINGKVHIIEVYVPNSTTMSLNSKSQTVDRDYYKVFVDPGHGGKDSGASGNGYFEDEINLQIAKRVESKLKSKGIEVKMSRNRDDEYLTLYERAEMANNYGADAFISIHQNSADSESANGIETFYHTDKTKYKSYSNEIQTDVIQATNARNRGVKYANFAVLRETYMASALIECGFISNVEESKKITNSLYQDKIATGIANGIETYLKNNIKLTETVDGISYQAHGEGYGWQSWKNNGELAGTTSQKRRVEAIKIKIANLPKGANIKYRVHGEGYGWQSWKNNGELAGTTSQSRRIEAIEIKLENAPGYSVEYRVHGEGYGWQSWKGNGEMAGTTSQSKRIEAIEIKLVKQDNMKVEYRAHGEDYGWQSWKSNGEMAGTTSQKRRVEAIGIKIENLPKGANIKYRVHGEDYGWQSWKSNGEIAGTTSQSKRIEAIEIKLENAPGYSIEYRVHGEGYGWQPWKSNGAMAGTTSQSKRIEAIEVKIIKDK